MGNKNTKRKNISIYEKRKAKIDELRVECLLLEKENTPNKIQERINYYEELFELENTKEDDLFQYMLSLLKLLNKKIISEQKFLDKLKIFSQGISDENYLKYFNKYTRQNSFSKIYNLLELICCDLENDNNFRKRKNFIKKLNDLSYTAEASQFIFKGTVSWENKELYLYNLYLTLLSILNKKINDGKKNKNYNIDENALYKYYLDLLKTAKGNERVKIMDKMEYVNLFEGEFFYIYIKNFKKFLLGIKVNFDERFKNNKLDEIKDQLLFEDYIQLLSTYDFKDEEEEELVSLWNQAFVPMKFEDKLNKINSHNISIKYAGKDIQFELTNNNILNKIKNGNVIFSVNNIDNYNLPSLLNDLTRNNNNEKYEYYLNKNLIPSLYDTELFLKKKWGYWKQILISILGSKSIKENITIVFGEYSDEYFFRNQVYLSQLLDDIRFYTHKTNIGGCLNDNSLRIYEYGLFSLDKKKSISLLFFYSFNAVTNIHEISGHFFVRNQNIINSKNKKLLDSPNIDLKNEKLFSNYAQGRKKESGESIEISLFGRRIRYLTIKEALYILEQDNYSLGVYEFKKGFLNCNSLDNKNIISEYSRRLLSELGINFKELPNMSNETCNIGQRVDLDNSENIFVGEVIHPQEFYCEKIDLNDVLVHFDIIREDSEKLKRNKKI